MPKNSSVYKNVDPEMEAYAKKAKTKRVIWTIISGFATVGMVGFAFSGMGALMSGPRVTPTSTTDGRTVIGTVDGIPLYQDDFDNTVKEQTEMFEMEQRTIPVQQTAFLRSSVLDHLIEGALLETLASKYNVTVTDSDISAERTKEISEADLATKLSLSPGATQAEIDNALTSKGLQPTTVMFSDDKIKSQLLQQKVKAAIDAQTVSTEADARAYYTQWHTQHILVDNKKRSDAQAQVIAQKITALAVAPGADFNALAKKYSDDPGTANKGGDDGWIDHTTQYVPEFKDAAFALKAGQVTTTPVKSGQYGYFIIKCEAVRSNLPKDFDKNKTNYINQVQDSARQDNFTKIITNLKNDPSTKINITDPRLIADRTVASISTLTDPGQVNAAYKTALTNYQTALNSPQASIVDKGVINSEIAEIYDIQKDTKDELPYLKDAADQTKDSGLAMQLGQLYLKNNDTTDAVTTFKSASDIAWNDPSVHYQLLSIYKTMKRPDLVSAESSWIANYEAQQKAAQKSQPGGIQMGGPGGLPPGVSVVPSSGGSKPSVKLVQPAGAPPPAPKPVQ